MLRTKQQHGMATVEFVMIGALLFLVLFVIIQAGLIFFNMGLVSYAALTGARTLSTQHGYNNPFSRTKTAMYKVLEGRLANKTTLDNKLAIEMFTTPCPTTCVSCTSDICKCANNTDCEKALGTLDVANAKNNVRPPTGTMAGVTLTYTFSTLKINSPLDNFTKITRTMTEPMQGTKDP